MPRYKASQGRFTVQTVFPEEFCRWLNYELFNSVQWNPESMRNSSPAHQQYECVNKAGKTLWRIVLTPYGFNKGATFISNEPIIYIRKGLIVKMGSGEVVIS